MRIRIKAPFNGAQSSGIFGKDGEEIAIGTELTVEKEPTGWAGRYDVLSGGDTAGKTAVTNPDSADGENPNGVTSADDDKAASTGPFTVGEPVSGWYPVLDANGEKVKSLRDDDAKAFQTLTPEDQVAFLAE